MERSFLKGLFGGFLIALTLQSVDAQDTITLVAGGDVEWTGERLIAPTQVVYDTKGISMLDGGWQPVPHVLTSEKIARLIANKDPIVSRYFSKIESEYGAPISQILTIAEGQKVYKFDYETVEEWAKHPFEKIAPILKSADIAFVNLETPLSDTAERLGAFRTPTAFTKGLNFAGIDIVSLANNHMLDAERVGMFDTMNALDKANIHHVGAGKNLPEARSPKIMEVDGVRVAFLAYTQYENSGEISFAGPKRSGVAALDPDIIKADIAAVKERVDHIILSFHWDIYQFDKSRQQELHPDAVKFARAMIDAGADAILGHHPHVPRAIEIYKGKPIFYSLSHLIFSFNLPHWMDNYLARLKLTKDSITEVEIIPVAGKGDDLGQPFVLTGERAHKMLNNLSKLSKELGTNIVRKGDLGIIKIEQN